MVWLSRFTTRFGSLDDYEKGRVEVIDDEPHHYAFSNVFDTASRSRPYEKVAVGKNRQYVLEAIRAEGTSDWRTCAHDEFALVMDGEVRIELAKLATAGARPRLRGLGRPRRRARRPPHGRDHKPAGAMTLLPSGAAYRFHADRPA